MTQPASPSFFFFFNDTATTEIYTLSLHDALPIFLVGQLHQLAFRHLPAGLREALVHVLIAESHDVTDRLGIERSEEHTSELQSRLHLVCRLLLEKKKIRIQRGSDQLLHKLRRTHG